MEEMLRAGELADPFAVSEEDLAEGKKARRGHGMLWRYFWGAHQRFFKDLCVASKVPAVIDVAKTALADGKCVVIGLQSTGEARTKDAIEEYGDVMDDFVSAPRATLDRFVRKVFACPDDARRDAAAAAKREAAPLGGASRATREEAPLGRTVRGVAEGCLLFQLPTAPDAAHLAATNAAMESVVPAITAHPPGRVKYFIAASVAAAPVLVPGARTFEGSMDAYGSDFIHAG